MVTVDCGAPECKHCKRPLCPEDIAWHFDAAESAMGVRSSHSNLTNLITVGFSSGGRENSIEARSVEKRVLEATAKHRCIRARLGHLLPSEHELLRAAFSADDWTNRIIEPQVRSATQRAFKHLAAVAPYTASALAHAARRLAQGASLPRQTKPSPSSAGGRRKALSASAAAKLTEAARDYFRRDPAVAGSAKGAVILAACSADVTRAETMRTEAAALVARIRKVAGIVEAQRSRRIRAVLIEPRTNA